MTKFLLPLFLILTSTSAFAGDGTTEVHCLAGTLKVDVEMVQSGDTFFTIQAKSGKTAYANNSSDPKNKGPATSTAVLDANNGVLAVVGLNIADAFTLQESSLISVPKTYVHKPNTDDGPGAATFSANLTGPATNYKNVLMKCTLSFEI